MLNLRAERDAIMYWICAAYGLDPEQLLGPGRTYPIGEARVLAYYLARRRGLSFPVIGRMFGKDHTTVMSGVKRAAKLLARDANAVSLVGMFLAERDAFDGDAMAIISGRRAETLERPSCRPPDNHVDNGSKLLGVTEGAPSDLDPKSGVENSGLERSGSLLSSDPKEPVSKPARARRWRFVPDDWAVKDGHRARATELRLDVAEQERLYRLHEFKDPKSDADKAFYRWLDRATDFRPPGQRVAKAQTSFERLKAQAEQLESEEKRNAAQ